MFGGTAKVDPESLERENDRAIDALGDRVGALRAMTHGIHAEVEGQHAILDSMSDSMAIAQAGIAGAAARFRRVFNTPARRKQAAMAAGGVFVLFLLMMVRR